MIRCQKTRPPRSVPLVLSRGFTLIELSIVVVIISMLLSLGLGVLNAQLVSAAHSETKKRQAIIQDALTAYLGANKRLPCPDVPNNTHGAIDTSQVTGAEDRTGGLATGVCSGNIGVVPYATLGLGREVALDGWGNFMSYSIPAGSGTCPGTGINWSLADCFGAAKTAPYSLFEGTVVAPTPAASNVLAMVISHGPNGFAAWGRQGSRNVMPLRCEETHNAMVTVTGCALTPNAFYKGDRTDVDDVVIALTRDEAINTLVKQGTLKSADGQVKDELGQLRSAWMDSLLSDCSSSPPTMVDDPWGNVYIPTNDGWPYTICSTRGGEGATPTCVSIYKTDMISLGATC
jgi:prepilin-type N-terminal cleavage/methylation domain-containing protein